MHVHELLSNRRPESDRSQHAWSRSAAVIAPPEFVDHPVELEVVVGNWILRRHQGKANMLRRLAYLVAEADSVEAVRQLVDEALLPLGAGQPGVLASLVPIDEGHDQSGSVLGGTGIQTHGVEVILVGRRSLSGE